MLRVRSYSRAAFTLLELIVVIVILGVLAALAIPTFSSVIDRSREETAQATLSAVGREVQALAAFRADGTFVAADFTSVAMDLPQANLPGTFAAGGLTLVAYDGSSGIATAGVISYQISGDGTQVGLSLVSGANSCVGVRLSASAHTNIVMPVDLSACHGGNALTGEALGDTLGEAGTSVPAPTFVEKVPLALLGGWENWGEGHAPASLYKDASGVVHLSGRLKASAGVSAWAPLVALPVGFRPTGKDLYLAASSAGPVRVDTSGTAVTLGDRPLPAGGWVSLDGMSYMSISAAYETFPLNPLRDRVPTPLVTWSPRSGWPSPSFHKAADGTVHLTGMMNALVSVQDGDSTRLIGNLPEGARPLHRVISTVATQKGSTAEPLRVDVTPAGLVEITGTVNLPTHTEWVSFSGISFATQGTVSPLALQNSWVQHVGDPYAVVGLMENPGRTQLTGLVRSGPGGATTGSVIMVLPVKDRPRSASTFAVMGTGSGTFLVHVASNGEVTLGENVPAATWLNLGDVSFYR